MEHLLIIKPKLNNLILLFDRSEFCLFPITEMSHLLTSYCILNSQFFVQSKRSSSECRRHFVFFTDRKGYSAVLAYSKRTSFVCYWCYRCQIIHWWIHCLLYLFCFGMYSQHLCKASDELFTSFLKCYPNLPGGILFRGWPPREIG